MKRKIIITVLTLAIAFAVFIVYRDVNQSSYLVDKGTSDKNDGNEKIAIIDSGANLKDIKIDAKVKLTKYNALDESDNVKASNSRGTMIFSSLYNNRSSMQKTNEVMIIKAFENANNIEVYNIVKALKYACDNKASIVNLSFNLNKDKNITKAIKSCQNRGAIIVASGNSEIGNTLNYPADQDGVISVGLLSSRYNSTVKVDPSDQQVCLKNKCIINKNVGLSTAYVSGYLIDYKDKHKASKDLILKPNFMIRKVEQIE